MAKESRVKIGDRFDKLEVVEKVDMPIMTRTSDKNGNIHKESTGKTKIGWRCKCTCGEEIIIPQTTLLTKKSSLRSCGKCPPEKNPNFVHKTMTFEENLEWEELYEYVKINVLGYDSEQLLPQYITIRLLGLSRGKYVANNKSANNAKYSYKTILNTFKFCTTDIQKALRNNKFKDEQHKFLYIAKIVENNVNDIYMRMKSIEKAKEEAENTTIDAANYIGADYQRKTKEVSSKLLNDLW